MFLLIPLSPASSQGAVYQWLDEKGNISFTDNPANIPEKYRQSATRLDETPSSKKPKTNIAPEAPSSNDADQGSKTLDDNGRDEQWWRARTQELRHRKELLLAEKERLTSRVNPLGSLGLGSIEANEQAKESKGRLEQIKNEIETIDYDLNVLLPEEARKANAPPGWLRE